jgi:hypothetical protein
MTNISPVRESSKALVEFPQKPASLFRQIAAAMAGRKVVAVCDSADSEEVFFILRGDVIAQLELLDGGGGDFHDRHFGDVEVVS